MKSDTTTASRRVLRPYVLPSVLPEVAIVIPVYNEADILEAVIEELREDFGYFSFATEILICENGSRDASKDIAERLAARHENVRVISLAHPSYGAAIKAGILHASAEFVFIFNADLWCLNFFAAALKKLKSGVDLVVGSKRLAGSVDHRPLIRRTITASFNVFLRVAYGFAGTDTHGLKALRRSKIIPVLKRCLTEREVFDTELVLRAQRDGLRITEVPVIVTYGRTPRMSLLRRVPTTLKDLALIRKTL